jgi:hypothetical protein
MIQLLDCRRFTDLIVSHITSNPLLEPHAPPIAISTCSAATGSSDAADASSLHEAPEMLCHSCNRPFQHVPLPSSPSEVPDLSSLSILSPLSPPDVMQPCWYCPSCVRIHTLEEDEPIYVICSQCDCDWEWQPSEQFPELGQVPASWRCPICIDPSPDYSSSQAQVATVRWAIAGIARMYAYGYQSRQVPPKPHSSQ